MYVEQHVHTLRYLYSIHFIDKVGMLLYIFNMYVFMNIGVVCSSNYTFDHSHVRPYMHTHT